MKQVRQPAHRARRRVPAYPGINDVDAFARRGRLFRQQRRVSIGTAQSVTGRKAVAEHKHGASSNLSRGRVALVRLGENAGRGQTNEKKRNEGMHEPFLDCLKPGLVHSLASAFGAF